VPYSERRQALEAVIRPIAGFASIVERTPIYLHHGRQRALDTLRHAFNLSAINREEGLVLKSDTSPYPSYRCANDPRTSLGTIPSRHRHRWVKLKRDYVPALGDCIDLVILGAGWDKDRARELRVDTSVMTTFHIGVLVNQDRVKARAEAPHFEILFRVSYGPSRDELEVYNANIRGGRWGSRVYDWDDPFKRVCHSPRRGRSRLEMVPGRPG
jgi:DNA ligase-4